MQSCEIVIRRARTSDEAARAQLIRSGHASLFWEAFVLFFFQELTLQAAVLCGAVLFIFCGVSARGLLLLLPAAAAAVAAAVALAHRALADKHVQEMRMETMGFVAELRGPLVADPRLLQPAIVMQQDHQETTQLRGPVHTEVVGTCSVSRRGLAGWLHALAVGGAWRGRGAGRALVRRAAREAAAGGLVSLEAVCSEVQGAARTALLHAGLHVRGAYARRLAGPALTLLLAHLGRDLPHA